MFFALFTQEGEGEAVGQPAAQEEEVVPRREAVAGEDPRRQSIAESTS